MNIYLLRHTVVALSGVCYGRSDVGLAAGWRKDFARCAAKLPPHLCRQAVVYSSPSSRCLRLARYLSAAAKTDARLMELDFGAWEGRRWDAIPSSELTPWGENFTELAPPGGESFAALTQRCGEFVAELQAAPPGTDLIVVTHSGVIRALLVQWLGLAPGNALRLRVDFGGLSAVTLNPDWVRVNYVNR